MITAPEELLTPRLILRKPLRGDAGDLIGLWAHDPEVTKAMAEMANKGR